MPPNLTSDLHFRLSQDERVVLLRVGACPDVVEEHFEARGAGWGHEFAPTSDASLTHLRGQDGRRSLGGVAHDLVEDDLEVK